TKTYFASTYQDIWQDWVKDNFVAKGGADVKTAFDAILQAVKQPTMWDWTVSWIPTFMPDKYPHYHGLIDYLVSNRWAYDYVVFCDRMSPGLIETTTKGVFYPIEVPLLDWGWMILGAVTMVLGGATWFRLRSAKQKPAAKPVEAAASAT
ncbi:MAG TPA: hypothetical protein V6D17_12225, partial [Candidatus Obscuribacterales bacterium]